MKFDLGEVLSSAVKITWRHKVLWLFSALPMLLSFIMFPFIFIPIMFMGENGFEDQVMAAGGIFFFIFFIAGMFISVLSYALYGIGSSALVLGVMRVDGGTEHLNFRELFEDSRPYWMRVLSVLLLIGLGVGFVFMAIFGCLSLFGAVTAGVGFLCVMPFYLVLYPLMLVLYGVIEESQVAVVADNLGVTDAIRRGWDLVRNNFWSVLIVSVVAYLAMGFFSMIVMVPFMLPFYSIPFLMDTQGTTPDPRAMMLTMGGFSLIFFPVMAFVQGIGLTFLKSTYTLVYLRLTKPAGAAPTAPEMQSA